MQGEKENAGPMRQSGAVGAADCCGGSGSRVDTTGKGSLSKDFKKVRGWPQGSSCALSQEPRGQVWA